MPLCWLMIVPYSFLSRAHYTWPTPFGNIRGDLQPLSNRFPTDWCSSASSDVGTRVQGVVLPGGRHTLSVVAFWACIGGNGFIATGARWNKEETIVMVTSITTTTSLFPHYPWLSWSRAGLSVSGTPRAPTSSCPQVEIRLSSRTRYQSGVASGPKNKRKPAGTRVRVLTA